MLTGLIGIGRNGSIDMLMRLIVAVVVAVVVGLACLLIGALLGGIGIPFVHTIGAFLVTWAWVLGLLAGLYAFATGKVTL